MARAFQRRTTCRDSSRRARRAPAPAPTLSPSPNSHGAPAASATSRRRWPARSRDSAPRRSAARRARTARAATPTRRPASRSPTSHPATAPGHERPGQHRLRHAHQVERRRACPRHRTSRVIVSGNSLAVTRWPERHGRRGRQILGADFRAVGFERHQARATRRRSGRGRAGAPAGRAGDACRRG